jgi:hypothetical protein
MEENVSLYQKMNSAIRTLAIHTTDYIMKRIKGHWVIKTKQYVHRLCLCVSQGSHNKQSGVITLNSINCLVFIAETMCFP